jgi:lipopolysaccharide export system permease protein
MKLIDRYIGAATLRGFFIVMSVVLLLFSLIDLLAELNKIGKGVYRMQDAFFYILLLIPRRMVDLMPICILLGSTISLGLLADRRELLAIQAAGVSVYRICGSVLAAGAILVAAGFFIGEYVAPTLDQYARIQRSMKIYGKGVKLTKGGFWIRNGRNNVHVGEALSSHKARNLEIYQLDEQGRLQKYVFAEKVDIQDGDSWHLAGVDEKTFTEQGIVSKRMPALSVPSLLSAGQLGVLQLPPESLSLRDLFFYISGLRERGQNAERYAMAFWQKVLMPVANGSMLLLALTFVMGTSRDKTAGRRIMLGALVAVVFTLISQVISHLGLMNDWNAPLTNAVPVGAVLGVAGYRMRNIS